MRTGIITPAPPGTQFGNRVTAIRWARILRKLGNQVKIAESYQGEAYDLLIALHARRSGRSIRRFRQKYPDNPVVVALTGTDLYHDLPRGGSTRSSLELASQIVVLQPRALNELGRRLREKTQVIYQSSSVIGVRRRHLAHDRRRSGFFDVCVIGHLRPVKDPFRTAMAVRRLPASSRIRVLHLGAAIDEAMARRAQREMRINARYRWLGEQPRWRVREILAGCSLCVLSSKMEGGANVLSEAIVAGVPILASKIAGSVGILGENYRGYFEVGNTGSLARLLRRAETDRTFLARLKADCIKLRELFDPAREVEAWRRLVSELVPAIDGCAGLITGRVLAPRQHPACG